MPGQAKTRTSRKRPAARTAPRKRGTKGGRAAARTRDAELAILDSVQRAIAAALDLKGI